MCSILGIIDFKKKDLSKKNKLKYINKYLNHRGPDDEGYFNDNYVSFCFNRLSIIDLVKGNQPIIKEHIVSIFNGEIYNFKEIKDELISLGYSFQTNSDSEIVASAFLHWGVKCVNKFNGMFAIAIYDAKSNIGFLRYDEKYKIINNQVYSKIINFLINIDLQHFMINH